VRRWGRQDVCWCSGLVSTRDQEQAEGEHREEVKSRGAHAAPFIVAITGSPASISLTLVQPCQFRSPTRLVARALPRLMGRVLRPLLTRQRTAHVLPMRPVKVDDRIGVVQGVQGAIDSAEFLSMCGMVCYAVPWEEHPGGREIVSGGWVAQMRQAQRVAVTRRHILTTLGTLIPLFALGACAVPVPAVLARPTPAPVTLPLVVAEAYSRDVVQGRSHTTVLDDGIRRWVAAAEAALHGRVTLPIQVVPVQSVGIDTYATTAARSRCARQRAGTTQPLWFATHDNLWRLRADSVLADLRAQVTKDHTLGNGRLHPDVLATLHWAGAQVGLPVALWPALLAMDARVPPPPAGWSWGDAAKVPAGSGWPVQLMPDMPPLSAALRLRLRPVWSIPYWRAAPAAIPGLEC
jgi:hypothetical protein